MTSSATDLSLPPITWVDVARRLSFVTRGGLGDDIAFAPPSAVFETEAFWTGLTVKLSASEAIAASIEWLSRIFPSRVSWDSDLGEGTLKLDAPAGMDLLPLSFEVDASDTGRTRSFRPTASLDGQHFFDIETPSRPSDALPVFAFHSVKGGVGRTTTALAFTRNLQKEYLKKPILIVDADFEAPGLSYLFAARKPESAISFEDLLVLVHADPSDDLLPTLDFIASRLEDQRIDDIFVLPAKRSIAALSAFAIRPEHVAGSRSRSPFLFVDLLRELAERLGCGAVVVDLRTGLVEIAMQLLTDPSVDRIFVTTTSGQSLAATCGMINALGQVQRETSSIGRKPLMVINQFPTFALHDRRFVDEVTGEIEAAAVAAFQTTAATASSDTAAGGGDVEFGGDSPLTFAILPHSVDLVQMSRDWDEFLFQIDASGFSRSFGAQLKAWSALDAFVRQNSTVTINQAAPPQKASNHKELCAALSATAKQLVVAESASEQLSTPLVTPPLRRLADDFLKQSPIAVIEGAKGTGKTLTFRFLVEKENWREAINQLDTNLQPEIDGEIIPVYGSSLTEEMAALILKGTQRISKKFTGAQPIALAELRRQIQTKLLETLTDAEWADFWLDAIAWVCGYNIGIAGAWKLFLAEAKSQNTHPIALFEGLEEVITNPYKEAAQASALRALVVDVPLRLRQEAGRPVGCLIFVRGDMVEAVIRQNLAQFRAGYRNYALAWSSIDILELVVWLAHLSGAVPGLWSRNWRENGENERMNDLAKIWGTKLGNERSREARSTEWVLAVLTDLNGRLTARDLVRFIASAANESTSEPLSDGRLLAPAAMRRAVTVTSNEKVREYPTEVAALSDIFERLKKASDIETPIDRLTAAQIGLNDADLKNLETYGVFFEEGGQFEVPELFRIGLGLKRKGARPNIISLTRRALEKAGTAV